MASIRICALCGLSKTLQKSHILQEFLYNEVYDDLHGYVVQSTVPTAPALRRRTGIYEQLLCRDCDQHRLGRLDDYAAKVFKGGIKLEMTEQADRLIIGNLSYKTFKLWQMSLLWRCGVS